MLLNDDHVTNDVEWPRPMGCCYATGHLQLSADSRVLPHVYLPGCRDTPGSFKYFTKTIYQFGISYILFLDVHTTTLCAYRMVSYKTSEQVNWSINKFRNSKTQNTVQVIAWWSCSDVLQKPNWCKLIYAKFARATVLMKVYTKTVTGRKLPFYLKVDSLFTQ